MTESTAVASFKTWFASRGGFFHPEAIFIPDPFGHSVHALGELPPDTTIGVCPFSLAITPTAALDALRCLLPTGLSYEVKDLWSGRQLICVYICLHWIDSTAVAARSDVLKHAPYIASLPTPDKLRASVYFTPSELSAFAGTNLYGATTDRLATLREEWSECRLVLTEADGAWGAGLTWERYLAAATYLSSRSFPSTILSATPSLAPTAGVTIQPVLLPGIDVFNHARRRAVSWVVNNASPTTPPDEPTSSDLSISLVLHDPIGRGQELYNNYGPKPNAQFILAFGFTLPQNPDDTIVLKVGGANIQGAKWEIGRGARGMDGLWQELLNVAGAPESKEGGHEFEAELDAAEMLHDMAYDLISRLPKPDGLPSDMRSEVYTMWKDYVEGQRDILESVVMFAEEREKEAIAAAKQQGIEIVREGED